jgi:hypothetical protein
VINGLATLEHRPGKAFLESFTEVCVGRGFEGFKPQELANIINGLAKLEHDPGMAFLESFTGECLRRGFEDFDAQHLANIINGLAKLQHDPGKPFLEGFTKACVGRGFEDFKPQDFANIINGLARLEHHPGKPFLEGFTGECMRRGFGDFNPQHLGNVINGLASLRHHPGEQVLAEIEAELLRRCLTDFTPQNLANFISAMAILDHRPSDECLVSFLKACKVAAGAAAQQDGKPSDAFVCKNVSSLVWSLSALEALDRPASDELLEALAPLTEALLTSAGEGEEAADLVLSVEYALWGHPRSSPGLQKLCGAVKRAWRGPEVPPLMKPSPSRLQRDVAEAARVLGLEVREEAEVGGGRVSVDLLVGGLGPGGVAVEVDGPTHFFSNREQEPTGATRLKRRLLLGAVERGELRGFTWVEYWAWREADKAGRAVDLLSRRLQEAGLDL